MSVGMAVWLWAIICKTCGSEIGLEEYAITGNAEWHKSETIKCSFCGSEHMYSGEDFRLSVG